MHKVAALSYRLRVMRQVFRQEQASLRLGPPPEGSTVVVYPDESGQWRWQRIGPDGDVTKTSPAAFARRDEATESAYESNPGTPVQVEVLNTARPA
jgi:hypothetical protein